MLSQHITSPPIEPSSIDETAESNNNSQKTHSEISEIQSIYYPQSKRRKRENENDSLPVNVVNSPPLMEQYKYQQEQQPILIINDDKQAPSSKSVLERIFGLVRRIWRTTFTSTDKVEEPETHKFKCCLITQSGNCGIEADREENNNERDETTKRKENFKDANRGYKGHMNDVDQCNKGVSCKCNCDCSNDTVILSEYLSYEDNLKTEGFNNKCDLGNDCNAEKNELLCKSKDFCAASQNSIEATVKVKNKNGDSEENPIAFI